MPFTIKVLWATEGVLQDAVHMTERMERPHPSHKKLFGLIFLIMREEKRQYIVFSFVVSKDFF